MSAVGDVSMTPHAPDGSRDRRIEDPTNLWIIHPSARLLLPRALSRGISANTVSIAGFSIGALAALSYFNWRLWPFNLAGLLLSMAWLVADGLDGMVARATNTASPLGRFLDGLCDHGVFLLLYVALASSLGTSQGWILGGCAAVFHGVQSSLYEGERARFHRRRGGVAIARAVPGHNRLVRIYDAVAGVIDTVAIRFDEGLRHDPDPARLGAAYGASAAKPLRLMSLLSANVRVYAIFVACIAGDPRLFWWFELFPLTLILIIGLCWHRIIEAQLIAGRGSESATSTHSPLTHSRDLTR
jgi:CDP-diacylglycerol--serine O-phosphatidyltransferase